MARFLQQSQNFSKFGFPRSLVFDGLKRFCQARHRNIGFLLAAPFSPMARKIWPMQQTPTAAARGLATPLPFEMEASSWRRLG